MTPFDVECARVRADLASLLCLDASEVASALERHVASVRSASAPALLHAALAHLCGLTRLLPDLSWWRTPVSRTRPDRSTSPLEELLSGRVWEVLGDLAELLSGPFDLELDCNWPSSVAEQVLASGLPPGARVGDVLVASGSEGLRVDVEVVATDPPACRLVTSSWRSDPASEVEEAAWHRLSRLADEATMYPALSGPVVHPDPTPEGSSS